jgi:chromosome segregation ATPase
MEKMNVVTTTPVIENFSLVEYNNLLNKIKDSELKIASLNDEKLNLKVDNTKLKQELASVKEEQVKEVRIITEEIGRDSWGDPRRKSSRIETKGLTSALEIIEQKLAEEKDSKIKELTSKIDSLEFQAEREKQTRELNRLSEQTSLEKERFMYRQQIAELKEENAKILKRRTDEDLAEARKSEINSLKERIGQLEIELKEATKGNIFARMFDKIFIQMLAKSRMSFIEKFDEIRASIDKLQWISFNRNRKAKNSFNDYMPWNW